MEETNIITATAVELVGEGVSITWSDGQTCLYPYRYLRLQCGCADVRVVLRR